MWTALLQASCWIAFSDHRLAINVNSEHQPLVPNVNRKIE